MPDHERRFCQEIRFPRSPRRVSKSALPVGLRTRQLPRTEVYYPTDKGYTIEYYHHFPSFLSNIQICKADFDVEMSKCGTTLFRVHSPVEPCKPVV